ncbi:MAG: AMP-binding protein [Sphingobium sp.]
MTMLTGAGAPFELVDITVDGRSMRGLRRAEASLTSLFDNFAIHGEKTFIVDKDHRLTFAQVEAAASRLVETIRAQGVGPGDRVALAGANSATWMVGFIAVVACGAIPALVNSRGTAENMAAAIHLVDARLVIADERRAAALALSGVPCLVPSLDPSLGAAPLPRPEASPDAPAMILFTSGTTGRAKGATLSHRAALTGLLLSQMAGAMIGLKMMGPAALSAARPQSVNLLAFPLFHVSGCHSIFLAGLASGGKVVVPARWNAPDILRLIEAEKVTGFSGSPTMVWDLIQAREATAADLSSLVTVSTGGQAQPVNLLEAVVKTFPNAVVGTGYGATETAGVVAMHTGADYRAHPRAAGLILPLSQIAIRDADGQDVAPGDPGEIHVRGPMVMSGYWNDAAATARAMQDGWMGMGDVGSLDAEGRLTILDRLTDMVISGGENIYCAEVEAALQRHPAVVEAAAYGVPDERMGERLVAVVCGHGGASIDEEDLAAHVRAHLADYRRPTEIIFRDEGLPRNALGKVDKRALRAAHKTEEKGSYAAA